MYDICVRQKSRSIIKAGGLTKPHDAVHDEDREERRGDLVVRGAIALQTDCVIDIKVINQNANSWSSTSTAAILSGGEREKIKKQLQACQDRRADFVP